MRKELALALLLATVASGAILDDYLPAEHRGGDDEIGIILDDPPAADPAEEVAEESGAGSGDEPVVEEAVVLAPVVEVAADVADKVVKPAAVAEQAAVADIESELELQLRDSLPPGVLSDPASPPAPVPYRPLYPSLWPLYPAPYLVYSAPRPLGPPVPWYYNNYNIPPQPLRRRRPQPLFSRPGFVSAEQPSVATSKIYDVTISSAYAPQKSE